MSRLDLKAKLVSLYGCKKPRPGRLDQVVDRIMLPGNEFAVAAIMNLRPGDLESTLSATRALAEIFPLGELRVKRKRKRSR